MVSISYILLDIPVRSTTTELILPHDRMVGKLACNLWFFNVYFIIIQCGMGNEVKISALILY